MSRTPKAWIVARHEYATVTKSKAFLISLLMTPILVLLAVVLIPATVEDLHSKPRRVALFDGTEVLHDELVARVRAAGVTITESAPRLPMPEEAAALAERIRGGTLDAYVVIGKEVMNGGAKTPETPETPETTVRVYEEGGVMSAIEESIATAVNEQVRHRRAISAGLDPDLVVRVTRPVPVDTVDVSMEGDTGEGVESAILSRVLPMFTTFLAFFGVMLMAQPCLSSIIEEKQQRVLEVLLGAVPSFSLFCGKLLGATLAGATFIGAYLGSGLGLAVYYDLIGRVPMVPLLWMVVFSMMSMLSYGSLFMALGCGCSDLKQAQSLATPVTFSAMLPMMFTTSVQADPHGVLATTLSLAPPVSALLMPARMAASVAVPGWQIAASLVLMVAFTLGSVFVASRIFRIGILFQGKAPSLADLVRWTRRG